MKKSGFLFVIPAMLACAAVFAPVAAADSPSPAPAKKQQQTATKQKDAKNETTANVGGVKLTVGGTVCVRVRAYSR